MQVEVDGKKGVHLDGSSLGFGGRLEVLEGPTGRRARSVAERARIAAESLMPGVRVTDVARKHEATRWQVYDWRRQLRQGQLALPENIAPMFAPLLVAEASPSPAPVAPPPPRAEKVAKAAAAKVEIVIGDAVIRTAVEIEHLSQIIRAVRSSR